MQIHFSSGNQRATASSGAVYKTLKSLSPQCRAIIEASFNTLSPKIPEENPHHKAGGAQSWADLLGCSVGTCWPSLSSLSMCSRVVLPALSKPRNTSFPDFLYKPRRKTNEQEKLQQAALSMGAEMPRRLTLFIYEPLSQSCVLPPVHLQYSQHRHTTARKKMYSLN